MRYFPQLLSMSSVRIILYIVDSKDLEMEQLDVKSNFLHGELDEVIYMKPSEGFAEKGKQDWLCLLKKFLNLTKVLENGIRSLVASRRVSHFLEVRLTVVCM